MRFRFAVLLAGAFLFATAPAFAGTVDFCTGQTPNTDVGLSLNSGGIVATGWEEIAGAPNAQQDLFCKVTSGDPSETGLGLATDPSETSDHEIGIDDFIQMDLSHVNISSLTLEIGSIQSGEGFQFYSSNTSGVLGTAISGASGSGGNTDTLTLNVSGIKYLNLTATSADVLLGTGTSTGGQTPEPGTYLLMGSGLLMLGFYMRRSLA